MRGEPIRAAVISDTHGLLRPEVERVIQTCDVVIHAGDFDSQMLYHKLNVSQPLYGVRGNNDGYWAKQLPKIRRFCLGGVSFLAVHDQADVPADLQDVQVVIFGHSHMYYQQERDGRLWLNPGSCGRRRFNQDITLAVLNIEDGKWSVNRIDIAHESGTSCGKSGVKNAGSGIGRHMERIPMPDEKDLLKVITQIMKRMDKGQDVTKIAGDMKIDPGFAEQICRIRVTHPGVTAHGILDKVEVNRTGR